MFQGPLVKGGDQYIILVLHQEEEKQRHYWKNRQIV